MLGALGGMTAVALILNRSQFRPAAFVVWVLAAATMWLHAHGGALCGAV